MDGNKYLLFFMMFFSVCSYGMESGLFLTEDILQKVVRPYLTLQTIARFAQTSKMYANIFEPGKIDTILPCFKKIEEDYHRCTHALGRFAQYKNHVMFKWLWVCDSGVRDDNIEQIEQKSDLSFADKMNAYHKYYSNARDVEKNIIEQLRDAIMQREDGIIDRIVQSKKYNIFDLFNDEDVEKGSVFFVFDTILCYQVR